MSVYTPLFDIHRQLTPMKTLTVSLFDMQPTDAKEDGLCAKNISIPVIILKDVTANLHTSNLFSSRR